MRTTLDCPFCANSDLTVIVVDHNPPTLDVHCPECGAIGPRSVSDDPAHVLPNHDHSRCTQRYRNCLACLGLVRMTHAVRRARPTGTATGPVTLARRRPVSSESRAIAAKCSGRRHRSRPLAVRCASRQAQAGAPRGAASGRARERLALSLLRTKFGPCRGRDH